MVRQSKHKKAAASSPNPYKPAKTSHRPDASYENGLQDRWHDLPSWRSFEPIPAGLWIMVGLAFLLRLVWLSAESLWLDEVYVYFDCKRPIWRILNTMHPLHFIVGKAFLSIHDSSEMLRLPCVLWGSLSIPVLFMMIRRAFGKQAAWIGAAFMAFSSYHFNYSLDANYYAAVIFFSTAGLLFFARYISDANPLDMILSVLCFLLGLAFHPFAGILVGPAVIVMIARGISSSRHRRALWIVNWFRQGRQAMGIFYLLVLIALGVLIITKAMPRIRSMTNILQQRIELGATFSNIKFGHEFFFDYFRRNLASFSYPLSSFEASLSWGAFLILCIGLFAGLKHKPWISILGIISIIGSFVLIFNLKADRYFHMRYLSALFPLYALFIAAGAVYLSRWAGLFSADEPSGEAVVKVAYREKSAPLILWGVFVVYITGVILAFILKWENRSPVSAYIGWSLNASIFLGLALVGRLHRTNTSRGVWRSRAAYLIFAPILIANIFSIMGRMINPHPNFKRVVKIWKEKAKPEDPIIFQSFGEWEPLRYYLPKAGLSMRNTIRLNDTRGETGVRLAQLRGLARNLSSGWLPRSWDIDYTKEILDWAYKHLNFVEFAPSAFDKDCDIHLFRVNIKDSYLNFPYGLRLQYNEKDNQSVLNNGSILFERLVDVDGASTYTVSIESAQSQTSDSLFDDVEIYVDGRSCGSLRDFIANGGIYLTSGKHNLGAVFKHPAPYPSLLWNILDLPKPIPFSARNLTIPFHSFVEEKEYQGKPALVLTRKVGVEYWFDFPHAGFYELTIQAVHDKGAYDKPHPVWLDIACDNQFQGILPFEKGDNTWDVRTMPISVPSSGVHSIAVNLVSGALAKYNLQPDEEITAILGNLSLRRISEGEALNDQRLSVGLYGARAPKTIPIDIIEKDNKEKILPGWGINGNLSNLRLEDKRSIGIIQKPSAEVEIPHDSNGIILVAPLRPIPQNANLVLAESMIETFDLINHSATLGIAFFGEDPSQGILPGSPVIGAQEGILRHAGPSRFSVASQPPKGARIWAPIINIYSNGTRPAAEPGYVRFGDVCVGEYD
ncbi:MAG TPA: glycosyltransferase family 39 protein [Candidatus Sumerlaeota bacterium]|nr:MAG: hypothetical protein BWY12_02078 [candidate division BRC1 bacterium ADurb.Bin183]HOE63504.1 glycosyltransferase family 39 protein [Candidatus Sumerlaeota bacterium]HRR31445.1 glycosyltransferase family 39 protein [Candidatus Sumerlaeia bacterium]HON51381.1 glycosyltransferase family 39 protein [Candidatus Sumerlaeota bacterium]HOR64566.1 glycosyltransferase family 39 protein [Candidatus Sumerlaeota bacterium]